MSRAYLLMLALAVTLGWNCQQQEETGTEESPADTAATTSAEPEMGTDLSTTEGKIANAESAGPEEIVEEATILDWPASEGGEMVTLRAGTNDYSCLPDDPNTPGNDPMCLDEQWMKWVTAWVSKTEPQIEGVGFGYMFQGGDAASLTDPHATTPPEGQEWAHAGPHLMVITPDASQLASLPTDPATGGPWVMWPGTPYVHIMVPVGEPE